MLGRQKDGRAAEGGDCEAGEENVDSTDGANETPRNGTSELPIGSSREPAPTETMCSTRAAIKSARGFTFTPA